MSRTDRKDFTAKALKELDRNLRSTDIDFTIFLLLQNTFTCIAHPNWGGTPFTIKRPAGSYEKACELAAWFYNLSGGFNNYSGFRYAGKEIPENDYKSKKVKGKPIE